jgi:predicted RNA-binding protein with TRAM domain
VTATEPEHVPGVEEGELVRVREGSVVSALAIAEVRA